MAQELSSMSLNGGGKMEATKQPLLGAGDGAPDIAHADDGLAEEVAFAKQQESKHGWTEDQAQDILFVSCRTADSAVRSGCTRAPRSLPLQEQGWLQRARREGGEPHSPGAWLHFARVFPAWFSPR